MTQQPLESLPPLTQPLQRPLECGKTGQGHLLNPLCHVSSAVESDIWEDSSPALTSETLRTLWSQPLDCGGRAQLGKGMSQDKAKLI